VSDTLGDANRPEWHACYSTPLEIQAHLVKGYLEQFGVPCILESLRFGMKPLTFGALGEVRVLVRDDWVHVARGLLRGREQDHAPRLRLIRRGEK
jgi:hypothetical protein